jgi:hypothetical protein
MAAISMVCKTSNLRPSSITIKAVPLFLYQWIKPNCIGTRNQVPYFTIDLFTTGYVFHGKGSLITTSENLGTCSLRFTFALADMRSIWPIKVFP